MKNKNSKKWRIFNVQNTRFRTPKFLTAILVFLLILTIVSAQEDEETLDCVPDWTCSDWSLCINNYQNRTCSDRNFCGIEDAKPVEFEECEVSEESTTPSSEESPAPIETQPDVCTENWKCAPWSRCIDGQQTRKCFDSNACGTEVDKPNQEQTCTDTTTAAATEPRQEETNGLMTFIYILGGLIIFGGLGFLGYNYFSIKSTPKTTQSEPVNQYINKMKAAGYNSIQIRSELVKAGYPQETINQHFPMHNPQLKKFTKNMLDNGYNFDQIQDHLSFHGYITDDIQEYFNKKLR